MLSPFQNIFSKIFQGEIVIKTPYQLQTNQDVCVENKFMASWKKIPSNSVGGQDWNHLEMNRAADNDGSKEIALQDAQAALPFLKEFLIQM